MDKYTHDLFKEGMEAQRDYSSSLVYLTHAINRLADELELFNSNFAERDMLSDKEKSEYSDFIKGLSCKEE